MSLLIGPPLKHTHWCEDGNYKTDCSCYSYQIFELHADFKVKKLIMCFPLHARVYSFYSRDTAFIPFLFEVTYFSVDIAVILILLKISLLFSFF